MRSLFESERWSDRCRSGPHERLGPRGMGQKTSDFSVIPLCSGHHQEAWDSYHRLGGRRFAQEHQLDLPQLVAALNHLDRSRNSVRAV